MPVHSRPVPRHFGPRFESDQTRFLRQDGSIRFRKSLHCQRIVAARSRSSRIFSNSHATTAPAPAPIRDPIAAHTTHHLPPSGLETSRMIAAVTKPAIVPEPTFCWRLPGMTPATSPASDAPMMPTPSHTSSSINRNDSGMRLAILHGLRLLQALNDTIERKNFRCDSDRLRVPKGLVDRCDTAALVRMRPLIGGPEAEAAEMGPPTSVLPGRLSRLDRFRRARPG